MAKWTKILQEAKSTLDREIPNWKREEEEYNLAKRRARGLPIPPSKARQDFLDRFNKWIYTVNIDQPDLTIGQAKRAGKEAFFHPETGAPAFFNPQRTLQLYSLEARPVQNGWVITIEFGAEFKTVQGKRLNPSLEELSKLGFEMIKTDHTPQPGRFLIRITIPHQNGIDETNVVRLIKEPLKEQLSKFMPNAKVNGLKERVFNQEDNTWLIGIEVEGIPSIDPDDVEHVDNIDITPL